jgi:glycosyltransferase involved in cell wall biosynthesis
MKIVIISDIYRRGGAAIAAYRIAEGYKLHGAEVAYVVGHQSGRPKNVVDIANFKLGRKRYHMNMNIYSKRPLLKGIIQKYYITRIIKEVKKQAPDIIHLHNIHGILPNLSLLIKIDRLGIPIVWTLHDMWAFTGHCAFSLECIRYKDSGCDWHCPYPDEFPPLKKEYVEKEFNQRKLIYKKVKNLHFVTPSRWLAGEVHKSMVGSVKVTVIPYGIDYDFFKPINKAPARESLGLSPNKKYILSGSHNLQAKRKGWRYFENALNQIDRKNFEILTYGTGSEAISNKTGIPMHHMGFINNERMIRILYSAADLFVIPSIGDNLPNVIIEAISCGTPCVGFDICGIPELVRNGITGYLAENKNDHDLAIKILKILDMDQNEYKQMSKMCRQVVREKYGFKANSKKYMKLFESFHN